MEPSKEDSTQLGAFRNPDSSLLESMLTGDGTQSGPKAPTVQIQPKSWSLAMEENSGTKSEPASITLKLPTVIGIHHEMISGLLFTFCFSF